MQPSYQYLTRICACKCIFPYIFVFPSSSSCSYQLGGITLLARMPIFSWSSRGWSPNSCFPPDNSSLNFVDCRSSTNLKTISFGNQLPITLPQQTNRNIYPQVIWHVKSVCLITPHHNCSPCPAPTANPRRIQWGSSSKRKGRAISIHAINRDCLLGPLPARFKLQDGHCHTLRDTRTPDRSFVKKLMPTC